MTEGVNNVRMFDYPTLNTPKKPNPKKTKQTIVVVNFEQFYQSPTSKKKMRKRQYWTKGGNQWKIIYEGTS